MELFLLGRALMKIGEDALPEPPGGPAKYAGSAPQLSVPTTPLASPRHALERLARDLLPNRSAG